MKTIHEIFLNYIELEDDEEKNYHNLLIYLGQEKISDNKNEFKIILHLISNLTDNFYRSACIFNKIEQIIKIYQNDIKKHFTNIEIFSIFKKNKRMLLYLFNEGIINPDKSIYYIISSDKYRRRNYPQYFYIEFKNFFDKNLLTEISHRNREVVQMAENDKIQFEQNRKNGENENQICILIRNDSINEFIEFINKSNCSITSKIKPSIFETNLFFLKKRVSLIEYAAFFGSIKIFKYLYKNGAALTESLWLCAIHGKNAEIIHIIEGEKHLLISDEIFDDCYRESIKCNHIGIMNYVKNNNSKNENIKVTKYLNFCIHYFNFIEFFDLLAQINDLNDFCKIINKDDDSQNANILCALCRYDYLTLFTFLFDILNANANEIIIIQKSFFRMKFLSFMNLIKFIILIFLQNLNTDKFNEVSKTIFE